ncbi:hypothetical protein BGX26_008277, partial [Mortierella sp. AD094]
LTPDVPNGGEIDHGSTQQCRDLKAKFAQVWVWDPEAQTDHRMAYTEQILDKAGASIAEKETMRRIFRLLQRHLEQQNPLCREYKNLRERMKSQGSTAKCFKLVLRDGETSEGLRDQRFGRPSTSEIASMIVEEGQGGREVMVEFQDKNGNEHKFVRIPEYTRLFDPLHFVLLHTKGEFGWEYKRYLRLDHETREQQERQQLTYHGINEDDQELEVYILEPLDPSDPDDPSESDAPNKPDNADMGQPDNDSSSGLSEHG